MRDTSENTERTVSKVPTSRAVMLLAAPARPH